MSILYNPTDSKTCLLTVIRSSLLPNNKISISTLPGDKVAQKPAGNITCPSDGGKRIALCKKKKVTTWILYFSPSTQVLLNRYVAKLLSSEGDKGAMGAQRKLFEQFKRAFFFYYRFFRACISSVATLEVNDPMGDDFLPLGT